MQEIIQKILFKRPEKNYEACLSLAFASTPTAVKHVCLEHLHIDEQKHLNSLTAQARIFSFCLGRYACKKAIQALVANINLHDIYIEKGVFTHPCPTHPTRRLPQVSCSHSAQVAIACAFPAQHPVGLDIEKISEKSYAAIKRSCSSEELNYIKTIQLKNPSTPLSLTAIWSMKESLSKAIKTGLMSPFKLLEIQDLTFENGIWSNTFKNFSQYKCLTWHITINSVEYALSMSFPKKSILTLDKCLSDFWKLA